MKPENFLEAISVLAQAKSEAEVLQVLKDHPEILDDEVDIMLQQLIYSAKQHGTPGQKKILGDMSEFLRTPQVIKLKRILSGRIGALQDPAGTKSAGTVGDMPRRIKLCQKSAGAYTPENELQWAQLQGELDMPSQFSLRRQSR